MTPRRRPRGRSRDVQVRRGEGQASKATPTGAIAKFAASGKVKLDSADKSDTVSFAYPPLVGGSRSARTHPKRKRGRANAVSKELGENRFKQLVKKVGEAKAMEMLKGAEQGFKDNYALLKKLSEM